MNPRQGSLALPKTLIVLGAVLVMAGSFLPWEVQGDFLASWRYGVQMYPRFTDQGGLLLLLLSVGILFLVSRLKGFRQDVTKNILTFAVLLVLLSGYHMLDWLVRRMAAHGRVGAPLVQVGLVSVAIGSILIFATAASLHAKASTDDPERSKGPKGPS